MANHTGSEGVVKIGTATIAEIKGWSFDESANTIDDTEIGDTWVTKKAGTQSWSGSVDCYWDETDTNGQEAMTAGASVSLVLYPEAQTAGDTRYSGTAIITGISRSGAVDGMVEASYSFEGNGAITSATS